MNSFENIIKLPWRFVIKVKVDEGTGCWLWTAGKSKSGYGCFRFEGKGWRAHRVSYTLLTGSIPDRLQLDHLCKFRDCVNPQHLEAVTQQENIRRGDVSKINLSKTHCPKGHEYSEENTYTCPTKSGNVARQCRTCRASNVRRYQKQNRELLAKRQRDRYKKGTLLK